MKKVVLISGMHFMDPHNFDPSASSGTIHYALPDGKVIPFGTMNSYTVKA